MDIRLNGKSLNFAEIHKLDLLGTKLIAKYYIFFLCLNIFLPKIDLGFGQFYIFDFTNSLLFVFLICRGKLFTHSIVISTYALFVFVCGLTFFVGLISFNIFDTTSFLRLIKFSLFILFLIIPYYIYRELTFGDLMKVLKYQLLFVALSGLYVVFHMIFYPKSISDYAWGYDNRYRLIGLTSYSIDLEGRLGLSGSTSVSMGVFIAFLFFIFFSLYKFNRKQVYLIYSGILFLLEFLTYSRAGILVLLVGLGYYGLLNLRPSLILKIVSVTLLLVSLTLGFNASNKLASFGTLSKITDFSLANDQSITTRVNMLQAGGKYIAAHPSAILLGTGYGEKYTFEAIGYDHLEGLVPTTLFTSGIFAVLFLFLHFYSVWYIARGYSSRSSEFAPAMYAIRIFVPGWFLSALLAGNTFQTDFYFPVVYFTFFISYFKMRVNQEDFQL